MLCGAYTGRCRGRVGEHSGREKARHSQLLSAGQLIILVIDSTDRDGLPTTREELYKMLAHEVRPLRLGEGPVY